MIEVINLKNSEHISVLIKTVNYGSMSKEFDPGPMHDDPFPEYHNTGVNVILLDTSNTDPTTTYMTYYEMKKLYPQVIGRKDRIAYYYVMKYIRAIEKEEQDRFEGDDPMGQYYGRNY